MTVKLTTVTRHFVGDTADTKPTDAPVGSTYLDRQTGILYITYDGTNWAEWAKRVQSAQLPTALAAGGGLKVEGVSGGVAQPVSIDQTTPGTTNQVRIDRKVTTTTGTIANGAATTGEIDLGGCPIAAIHMPAAWTAASLAVSVSPTTGGTFYNLYDDSGNRVIIPVDAQRCIGLDAYAAVLAACRFVKLLSVDATGVAVNQGAERVITLILKG